MFNIDNINTGEKRIIFHIDFDYFFAQCEEIRNPSIKDIPVVICVYSGRTKESGIVSTENYKLLSNQAMKIIISVTTVKNYEIIGLDECYLDMTNFVSTYKNAISLARDMKTRLSNSLHLGCSIGISYNKLLA